MKAITTTWKLGDDILFNEEIEFRDMPAKGLKFIWHYTKLTVVDVEVNFDNSTAEIIVEKRGS